MAKVLIVVTTIFVAFIIATQVFKPKPASTNTSSQTSVKASITSTSLPTATSIPPTPLPTETPIPEISTVTTIPTQTSVSPISTLGVDSTLISDKDGMVMDYVPVGTFPMGSNSWRDSQPIHNVTLDAFWIDETDVTNAMYAKCVSLGACQPPTNVSSETRTNYYGNSQFDNYPVVYVNWNMANSYCQWAGRRLPTEAEWEKAARGTDGRIFPWGNTIDRSYANYNSWPGDTSNVRFYESGRSPYGAYDMAGNVWQWVSDWFDGDYYETLGQNAINPQGPNTTTGVHVVRGGSWYDGRTCELNDISFGGFPNSAWRCWEGTLEFINFLGFRCALSATP